MRILLTGANGYIGRRLLTELLDAGHHVTCLVRDRRRFSANDYAAIADDGNRLEIVEADLLDRASLEVVPRDIDAAYYLVHSMGSGSKDFFTLEETAAKNFTEALASTQARQVVYLSGIVNESAAGLSRHLASRLNVEHRLREGKIPVTVLRAAIIVGAGSASFEIMRDLVEKLPVMIAPKWLRTPCQPIAVRNVLDYLTGVLDNDKAIGETFDIGGPEVLTYQELLLQYASVQKLRRFLIPVPLLTPRLSGYWLYFVTSRAWRIRGWLDRLAGGAGLRRGRRHPSELRPGDALDFWRVLVADAEKSHLILFAEMKLPGEAWLEFRIVENAEGHAPAPWRLEQVATFRPRGLLGRLYWLSTLPLHHFVFSGMARSITTRDPAGAIRSHE